jgi:tetratricopeptide (TPR) repeat protein
VLSLCTLLFAWGETRAQPAEEPRAERSPAEERDAAATDDAAKTRAREHFDRGLVHLDARRFAQALTEFQEAYRESPHPIALYNVGLAQIALEDPVAAVDTLERFLREAEAAGTLDTTKRDEVQRLLKGQRMRIAVLRFDVRPPGAMVTLDGREVPAASSSAAHRVQVGEHRLRVALAEYEPQELAVKLTGGEERTLHVALIPVATEKPEASHDVQPPQRERTRREASSSWRTVSYVVGGSGLALGLTAGGLYFYNRGRYSDYQSESAALDRAWPSATQQELPALEKRRDRNQDLLGSVQTVDGWSIGLAIAGGALLASGGALWLTSGTTEAAPSAFWSPGGARVGVHGRF